MHSQQPAVEAGPSVPEDGKAALSPQAAAIRAKNPRMFDYWATVELALPHTVAPASVLDKRIATLTARAALKGFQLVLLADGSFLVARQRGEAVTDLLRALVDVEAVEDFLRQIGGPTT